MELLLLLCVILAELTSSAIGKAAPNEGVSGTKFPNTSSHNIEIPALDRFVQFGDLYDATTDSFMLISAFNGEEKPGDFNIITTNITSSKIDFIRDETYLEKMEKFDIQPSLYLSALIYLYRISNPAGSSSYLMENKKSEKSVKASLVYRIRTVREELQVLPNISKSILSDVALNNVFSATHVVVGIEWGVDSILSLQDPNPDPSNAIQLKGKFEDALKKVADMITTTDPIDSSKFAEVEKSNNAIIVDFFSDYNSLIGMLTSNDPRLAHHSPISICLAEMRKLPDLMKDVKKNGNKNNGKGKRVKYILMPIDKFRENFGEKSDPKYEVKQPNQETTKEFLRILQNLKDSELQFKDLNEKMKKWEIILNETEFDEIEKLEDEFDTFYYDWKGKLEKKIIEYRRGSTGDDELNQLISSYGNSTWKPEETRAKLEAIKSTFRKLEWANRLQKAKFIKKCDIFSLRLSEYDKEIRIVSIDLNNDKAEHYVNEIVKLLETESAKTSDAIPYYIVQEEIEKPEVKTYQGGKERNKFTIE